MIKKSVAELFRGKRQGQAAANRNSLAAIENRLQQGGDWGYVEIDSQQWLLLLRPGAAISWSRLWPAGLAVASVRAATRFSGVAAIQ
jgi:hypothetical protein